MKLKKFQAPSVREALIQVKEEFGSDAVIIRTEKLKSGLLGGADLFEVTAALDENAEVSEPTAPQRELKTYTAKGSYRAPQSEAPVPPVKTESAQTATEISALRKEIHELKSKLDSALGNRAEVPEEFISTATWLKEKGLPPELVLDIVSDLIIECPTNKRSETELQVKSQEVLKRKIKVKCGLPSEDKKSRVWLFVGPTGVGKSTTIAKLAADAVLNKGRKVAIVSTDAYRIGALEQMELFSRAAEIDFEAVFDIGDIEKILDRFASYDLIFVDTAGRAKNHHQHMAELTEIKEALLPDEVHLTLSANTRDKDLDDAYRRFADIGVTQLLFTKVDETLEPGGMINLSLTKGSPLSYLCDGQNIPDDLHEASPNKLVELLLGS